MDNNNTYFTDTNTYGNPKSFTVDSFMYIPEVTVKIVSTRFSVPTKGTKDAAAYDLQADLGHEKVITVAPGETKVIGTGISLELPNHLLALLLPRSGLATKHGITLANSVGLIDPDYRGDIKVAIKNTGYESFLIKDGDRIAQMLLMEFTKPTFVQVKNLFETERGSGGFGSTGV